MRDRFIQQLGRINKLRTLTLLSFLAILIAFPFIFSQTQKENDFTQRANAQLPPAGTVAFMIYGTGHVGDTFAPGWTSKSWYGGGNTVNQTNTDPVYAGQHSLAYQSTAPYDTMELYTTAPIDISRYTYLNFYAKGGMPGLKFAVSLLGPVGANGNHTLIGTPLNFADNGGEPPTDKWFVYGFPVAAFNAGTTQIYGVGIMDQNGGGSQFPVFIDEVAFSQARATETTPTVPVGPQNTQGPEPTRVPDYYPNISPWVFIIPAIIIFIAIFFE